MPQYEIFPRTSYSGSYTDIVMTGSTGTTLSDRFKRSQVGSNAFEDVRLYEGILNYGEYKRYLESSSSLALNQRFISLLTTNKTIANSYIPDMDDIFAVDNSYAIFTNYINPSHPNIRVQYAFGTKENGVLKQIHSTFAADNYVSLSNNAWVFSYPYENKYRNVRRRIGTLIDLSSVEIFASRAFSATSASSFDVGGIDNVGTPANAKVLDAGDAFSGGFTGTISITGFQVGFVTGKADDGIGAGYTFTYNPVEEWVDISYPPVPTEPIAVSSKNTSPALAYDTIRWAYGFGDGVSNIPLPTRDTVSSSHGVMASPVRVRYGSLIRGWKYGLYSGLPSSPKVVFRRNRFGQYRDMLEQRIYTKEIAKDGTIDNPITITFLSGSDFFATASNQSTLNLRNTGIYDFEYISGKPFEDI